jgi:hypothetical protein
MSRGSFRSQKIRAAWGGLLVAAVITLAACGDSGSSTAGGSSSSPDPVAGQGLGTVTVRVTTSSGTPLADVAISLNGGFDGRSARSDESGSARFADIRAGDAIASTYAPGYHAAYHRFVVAPQVDNEVTVILENAAEATPVVMNSRAVAASDGRSLTIDIDLALLDENGRAIAAFTVSDFAMIDSDCAFVPCGYDVDFGAMPMGGYRVRVDAEAFRWHALSDRPVPPMAVGLLLDQSADMAGYDPDRLRLPPVKAFLQSVLPPGTVSLATYRDTNGLGVNFQSYGGFTSDGALFIDAVDALAGQEAGGNPLDEAVSYMRFWTATNAPSGVDDPSPSVVVVTGSSWDSSSGAFGTEPFAEYAATLDIPVVAIGGGELGAALAAGSGGAFVAVSDPLQFEAALGGLNRIVGRTLDYNHLRFVLSPEGASATGPVFRPGRQSVWAYVYVRIGPHTRVEVPLVIPVQ